MQMVLRRPTYRLQLLQQPQQGHLQALGSWWAGRSIRVPGRHEIVGPVNLTNHAQSPKSNPLLAAGVFAQAEMFSMHTGPHTGGSMAGSAGRSPEALWERSHLRQCSVLSRDIGRGQ